MTKTQKLKTCFFLNRLALDEMANPDSIDPYSILNNIFSFESFGTMQDMFRHFCEAGLAEEFSWKEGSPGNLLYFSERLEQLIEACFIIYSAGKIRKNRIGIKKSKQLNKALLPIRLSEKELNKPFIVIKAFFAHNSLPEWKLAIHRWTEAGLSKYSVAESAGAEGILSFYRHLEKLIEVSNWIAIRLRKKNNLK
jgi:hypothetical protein